MKRLNEVRQDDMILTKADVSIFDEDSPISRTVKVCNTCPSPVNGCKGMVVFARDTLKMYMHNGTEWEEFGYREIGKLSRFVKYTKDSVAVPGKKYYKMNDVGQMVRVTFELNETLPPKTYYEDAIWVEDYPTSLVTNTALSFIKFYWNDPVNFFDPVHPENNAVWEKTILLRKANTAPTSSTDGEVIGISRSRNEHIQTGQYPFVFAYQNDGTNWKYSLVAITRYGEETVAKDLMASEVTYA